MNYKLICELMAKVGNDCGQAPGGMWAEKFAELIVQECIQVIDKGRQSWNRSIRKNIWMVGT